MTMSTRALARRSDGGRGGGLDGFVMAREARKSRDETRQTGLALASSGPDLALGGRLSRGGGRLSRGGGRHVLGRVLLGGGGTKEELLRLLQQHALALGRGEIDPVFVHHHLR